ncbi:TldD/PmbA family protein [Acidomonas methanolica]|uniref:TldD/PmbA family protein n=1 Tax=Acidomonas methanolica TaxID=437 RepID=UPI00211A8E0C|nr:TldD/PmbA family protein [Acidomonas methanolica]MCQ9154899.1 TldD/PmbA family protein [Acidomonas methanolica]
MSDDTAQQLRDLLEAARKAGADKADAVAISSLAVSAMCRKGVPEGLEHSETSSIGLRVFIGQRAATVSATELDPARFDALAEQAVAMARVLPEDFYLGLADPEDQGSVDAAALDLADPGPAPDLVSLLERARAVEDAALAVTGVTNSSGASASYGRSRITLADTNGFAGSYSRTSHGAGVSVLAGVGESMQRDYASHGTVHLADLDAPERLGREAGERAVRRLDPGKPRTGRLPVVFDPRVSGSLPGHLVSAINGAAIARGTSFLAAKMGEAILPPGLSLIDDPLRPRGLRSRPFDGEGHRASVLALVENGVLREWVLDTRAARQLGLKPNGRAVRGVGAPPAPGTSNLYLAGGATPVAELIADIVEGVWVDELMGSSINGLTGDYSRGASGFMIRNGQLAEPVAELTIAGNLLEMFQSLRAADDLVFRRGIDAPTLRIDGMRVAGS